MYIVNGLRIIIIIMSCCGCKANCVCERRGGPENFSNDSFNMIFKLTKIFIHVVFFAVLSF